MTIEQIYEQSVKPLPAGERFRLAALILRDIPPESVVDYSEAWSDEDYQDFTNAGWRHVNSTLDEGDNGGSGRRGDG